MTYAPPSDPHLVATMFKRDQLTCAREINGYTKAQTAELIGKTASAITQYESGAIQPDPRTVSELSVALNFPPQFFAYTPIAERILLEECNFRRLRSASQILRRQSVRIGELSLELFLYLEEQGISFPEERITEIKTQIDRNAPIEDIAIKVRNIMGLGAGPIQDPIALIENMGVVVLQLNHRHKDVDAFSTWVNGKPVMLISMDKNASRTHFDVAHELAHLILHEDVIAGDPAIEKEADNFASSFLLPSISFLKECPRRWEIKSFLALKRRWYVSLRALLYNAKKYRYLSDYSYKSACIFVSKNYGYDEPDEWDLEKPSLLKQALEYANNNQITMEKIAKDLCVNPKILNDYILPSY